MLEFPFKTFINDKIRGFRTRVSRRRRYIEKEICWSWKSRVAVRRVSATGWISFRRKIFLWEGVLWVDILVVRVWRAVGGMGVEFVLPIIVSVI